MRRPDDGGTVRRPRLEEQLVVSDRPRLISLTAGPGSGKTTLLTQAFADRTAVWHTLTPADRSLSVLARNIVRKLRLMVPQLSAELVTAVEGARGPDVSVDSGRPVAIAAALAHDLDLILGRDVILVLDDVHELEPRSDSANFLAALCRHVPARLRMVTASRHRLPFAVARMRVAGDLSEIDASDLAFTVTEIEELVVARLGREDQELAKEISALTAGWPVAVVLAMEAAVQGTGSVERHRVEQEALFDYLAEEVLAAESVTTVTRLRDLSLLPWFEPDLLSALGFEGEMPSLGPSSVYLSAAPDVPRAQVVAPLVRDFLLDKEPPGAERDQELLATAASWYRSNGALMETLTCVSRSGDQQAVVDFISREGDTMVAAGHTRQLIDEIGRLPASEVTPAVALIDAEARQLLGDWEGAEERYRVLVPERGPIPPGLAWRLGFLKHMQGKVGEALETYGRGETGTGASRDEASLLGWHASAHWLRGQRDRAKELADAALELAREADDPRALATAHTVLALVAALDGDRAANDVHYLKALEHAERGRDVVQTIRIRSNRASAFLEEGEFDAALAELEIALRLADMTGFELWRGMSLSNRAQVYAYRGRLEEAVADLTESRSAFRRIGSLLESYPVTHLGEVYRLRGDRVRARAAYEQALQVAGDQEDLQVLVPALTGMARLLAPRDGSAAVELAERAISTDAGIGHALALVASGWANRHNGDEEAARKIAEKAAHVARTRRDLPGLGEALELLADVDPESADSHLEEAASIWRRLDVPIAAARVEVARARLIGGRAGARRAAQAAEALKRHGAAGLTREARAVEATLTRRDHPQLLIKTLGGFDVVVKGESVPRAAWQSRVAREILWMLLAVRGRPLNREVIIERLWPDDDPSKASNRLSVALSTIRKVLDLNGGSGKDYIDADREAVRFDVDQAEIDIEGFLDDARHGRSLFIGGDRDRGHGLLLAAEERYAGEFLEEEPYADWAISLREEARTEYLNIARLLAESSLAEGDHDAAVRRYLRMIERDPFSEPAHLGLVRAMRRSGRHGAARRLYGTYVTRMAELDVEPEPFPNGADSDHS